ncbi:MAG TPA: glucans biosynthesis glucosyltransferase MdoH [Beijerinckiaceae bacterium]|nr:glucans biosynthesis glucosyltransferase MdoH [Beijerinckiaceae bacterium]
MQAFPVSLQREVLTPTGTQSVRELKRRRQIVALLNIATWLMLIAAFIGLMASNGWTLLDTLMLVCFIVGTPWTVLGFWNSIIGLMLLHSPRDAMVRVAPFADAGDAPDPITIDTAVLMTLRNEDPARAFLRLKTVRQSLEGTGFGGRFAYFVLSDTNDPAVAAAEEAAFAAWKAEVEPGARLIYRRRTDNAGFKAGNVRDFCATWGADFELMLPLDADSLMDGPTIVRHVRMMQVHSKLGILQSLVVGMPSKSAFARIFQFGMRHGMRAYTMGSAWWIGDCGPFWGHNALVRIKPFFEDCDLPVVPGGPPLGGPVLSHDQVEATLMRRAGYEVRVLPEEGGSWEENPPTMLEFARRDVRWCQGNLQYLKLLDFPGLYPVSRFQLIWAILMFIGIPAWTLLIALAALKPYDSDAANAFPTTAAIVMFVSFLTMSLMPKLCGLADILMTRGGTARYGGTAKFLMSAVIEIVFSFLQGAVSTLRTTIFMVGLLFGASVVWGGQARDAHGISWSTAFAGLWPQLLFGTIVLGLMAWASPLLALWSLPLTAGYLLAMPFAVWTADPDIGAATARAGLAMIPEEVETPDVVRIVQQQGD